MTDIPPPDDVLEQHQEVIPEEQDDLPTSDPEVPAIFQEAGFTQGPPKSAEFLRQHDA